MPKREKYAISATNSGESILIIAEYSYLAINMDHLLAAVDLGSNSFRLSIGRVVINNGQAQIYAIDRLNESVRLAAGMGADKRISPDAIERAVTILKRFNERLQGFHPNRVRAVATNTFRVACNLSEVLPKAEAALGFPIEVISGHEEARLIFSGISNELPPSEHRRLMIDIGGGSTEVIIGKGLKPQLLSSLYMGCVSFTDKFFEDGRITEERMNKAILAARRELEGITRQYRKTGWQEVYGSSGTAKGLIAILEENGYSAKGITLQGMEALKKRLINDGKVDMDKLAGVKPHRAPVLAAGLAIMMAAFQELKIKTMLAGEGALRVGVLYDMLGRDSEQDQRLLTVQQLSKRYHVDARQAHRVEHTTEALFKQLGPHDPDDPDHVERLLKWAAELHEIGLSIAHTDYHKHTAYILEYADMPGFSKDEQTLLSFLTLGHQGRLSKLKRFEAPTSWWYAMLCLRLAVILMRRREDIDELPIRLVRKQNELIIKAPKKWLERHPLTEYSLQTEQAEWEKMPLDVVLSVHN